VKIKMSLDDKKREHLNRKTIKQEDGCHIWTGQITGSGYGRIEFSHYPGRYRARTHRVAYELAHGPIPEGMLVCHTCDVRLCCNPKHLFLGTYADNYHDMVAKGRSRGKGNSAVKEQIVDALLLGKNCTEIQKEVGVRADEVYRRVAELWFKGVPRPIVCEPITPV